MEEHVKQVILAELQTTGLSSIDKDLEGVDEVLLLKGRDLSSLSERKLSEYIYIATQYQLYLQLHYNIRHVEFLKVKRRYEVAINKELITIPGKQPIKEKIAEAMKKQHLINLEAELSSSESKYTLLNKMPEVFLELANALKKELSLRHRNGK